VERIFSVLVAVSGVLAIWWAHSDGAMVGLVAGVLVLGLMIKPLRLITIGLILVAIGYSLFAGIPASVIEKITFADWSGQVRLSIWSESWRLIRDNWLMGVGLSGYQQALVPYHLADYLEIFLYPHNYLMNFWVELGLLGALTFIWIPIKYAWLGVRGWHRSKTDQNIFVALIVGMVVILVHGLVDVPFFKNDLAILWWIFIGLMSSSYLLFSPDFCSLSECKTRLSKK